MSDNYQKVHAKEDEIYSKEEPWTSDEIEIIGKIIAWREKHGWADWEFNEKEK